MRRFLLAVFLFLAVPVVLIVLLYVITDPYKTLKPFSLGYFDTTNRDYLSSELFLHNYPEQKYDSYIFGSSRCGGINTYQWLSYLPEGSKQFLFQAWSESITGIEQKISYIDNHGYEIRNALILIDIPGSFAEDQLPKKAMSIKHPSFSGQPLIFHQLILCWDFLLKPSQWISAIKKVLDESVPAVEFDPVSNDWDGNNRFADLSVEPEKDSLGHRHSNGIKEFLKDNENRTDVDLPPIKDYIGDDHIAQLRHIKAIFDKQHTDYRIIISPAYCYAKPKISDTDFDLLQEIFAADKVYDYSGKNYLTSDYNNFSDPEHFGQFVGWNMLKDIYEHREIMK